MKMKESLNVITDVLVARNVSFNLTFTATLDRSISINIGRDNDLDLTEQELRLLDHEDQLREMIIESIRYGDMDEQ